MTPKLKDHQKSCSHFKGFHNYRSARHRTRGNILGWDLKQTQPTLQKDQLLQRSFSCTEKPLCRPSILCDVQSKHTAGVFFKSLSKKVFLLSVPPLAEWLSHPTGAVQWNGNQDMLEMSAFHFYPNSSFRGSIALPGVWDSWFGVISSNIESENLWCVKEPESCK